MLIFGVVVQSHDHLRPSKSTKKGRVQVPGPELSFMIGGDSVTDPTHQAGHVPGINDIVAKQRRDAQRSGEIYYMR